jgi:hypothetical protein
MSNFASTGWTYVQGKFGYATSDTGPNGTGAFSVFDLSVPSAPVLLGQINSDARLFMAEGVQVCGRYAFVAVGVYQSNSAILVIDVSAPTAPVIVASLVDLTNLYWPEALLLCGQYLLVSCDHQVAGKPNFTIVNVANPLAPVVAGSLAPSALTYGAVYIDAQGKYAFMTCRNVTAGYGVVAAIDVTNPAAPALVGTFGTSSGPFSVAGSIGSYLTGIDVFGQYAYVAASGAGGVVVLNVSNPAAMTQVGSTFLSTYLTNVSNVHLAGTLLYCSSYQPGVGVTVLDVTNPAAILFVSNTPAFSSSFESDHMDLDGDFDFQADTSAGGGVALIALGGIHIPSLHVGRLYADDVHIGKDLRLARNFLLGGAMSPAPAAPAPGYAGITTVQDITTSVAMNTVFGGAIVLKPTQLILTISVVPGATVQILVGPTSTPSIIVGGQDNTGSAAQSWSWTWTVPVGWYCEIKVTGSGGSMINQLTEQY